MVIRNKNNKYMQPIYRYFRFKTICILFYLFAAFHNVIQYYIPIHDKRYLHYA